MINYLKPTPDIFGLDISDFSLKAARIKNLHLHSFISTAIKPELVVKGKIMNESEFASILVSLINKMGPGTKYVSVALPEERSFVKAIRMPKMDKRELEGAVAYEAENHFPLPLKELYLGFDVIRPVENGDYIEILLVALPREVVDPCVSALSSAGFFVVSIEIESLAIIRSLIDIKKSEDPILIVDMGEKRTSFTIFSDKTIRFTGSIQISSDAINLESDNLIRNNLCQGSEPATEELIQAIKRHLDYYHSRMAHKEGFENLSSIMLCGGAASIKGLHEKISLMTDFKVAIANPFINLLTRPKKLSLEEGLRYGVAIGTAMKQLNR